MATPTRAELETKFSALLHISESIREYGESVTDNFIALQDTAMQASEGDNVGAIAAGVDAQRAGLAAAYANSAALQAHLRDWARFLSVDPDIGTDAILDAMYEDAITNSRRLTSRGISFATPPAITGTGSGAIRRLPTDSRGFDIESGVGADVYTARCIEDANLNNKRNQEVFLFRAGDASADGLESLGSGAEARIPAFDSRDSLLLNPSFDDRSGSNAAPTDINNWTSNVGVSAGVFDFASGTASTYLPARRSTDVVRSLDILTNMKLTQRIDLRGTQLGAGTPMYQALAYDGSTGSASCTLTIRMGAVSASVVISAGQVNTWDVLENPSSFGSDNWYRSQVEEAYDIEIETTDLASGVLRIDDMFYGPWTFFAGSFYFVRPGNTPFRGGTVRDSSGDTATWTDTATESVLQRQLAHLTGRYLPATSSGGATLADP